MTKILYIPTGEYLRYYDVNGDNLYGPSLVRIEDCNDMESAQAEVNMLIEENSDIESAHEWLEANNIILPILKSELEIIYD